MNRPFERWLPLAAGLTVAMLVVNVALTFNNVRQLREDTSWVTHTQEVIRGLERLLSLVKDAETGQRGYVITGDARYLEPYDDCVDDINARVEDVERLIAGNDEQLARFQLVRQRLSEKVLELKATIFERTENGFESARALIATDIGKQAMEGLREVVAEMVRHEERQLAERELVTARAYRWAVTTGLISGLAALAAIASFLLLMKRHLAARARATQEIAEQGERLRTTLASIGDAVITTDTEGRVTGMNAVAEALTAWPLAEATGQPLDAIFRIVTEGTRQPVRSPALRALREGVIVGLANHTVLLAKDGTEHPIDDSAAPIRCREGTIVGCVLVFRDIAERVRAETALRDNERRYRAIGEAIDFGVWMTDTDGRNTYASESFLRLVGLTQEECSNTGWTSVLHPDDAEATIAAWKECVATGGVWDREHRFRGADGQWHSVLARGVPVRSDDGGIIGWAGINLDISRLKHAEEALREADGRKDEFLATLAHELRTPLAPMRNAVSVLQMQGADAPAAQWARDVMDRQIQGMTRLVDDLLDVSRISRNRLELRRERIELADVVASAVETSRPLVEEQGHELVVSLPAEPIALDGDLTRLAQVFWNLLNNAAKYTDRGGRIELRAERQGSDVVVSVTDSGIGIAAEHLPAIFRMFSQLQGALSRSQGGLGIGLSLVRRLVELHGGTIEARSDGPGRGSEFVVRLPILLQPRSAPASAARDGAASPRSALRILVVDDSRDAASSLALLLKMMGNTVRIAHDGEEAIHAASEFHPQVVLLDIGLPKMNGYDAARAIRRQPWSAGTVFIAVTGWGQEEDRRKSEEAGFDRHMVKPIDFLSLMKLLAGLSTATS